MKSSTTNVETPINDEVFHEVSESFQGESSSYYLNDDVQQSPEEVIPPQTYTQLISINMIPNGDEASTLHNVFNEQLKDAYFDAIHCNLSRILNMTYSTSWIRRHFKLFDSFCSSNLLHVNMDDRNITMEEYIRLEEEKARRHDTVYTWETVKYGKIWCNEDVHDLRSVETEFPAIVFNDALTSEVAPSCEPTISPINDNQIDFRISFEKSDDEDYTMIYDEHFLIK
nr:hypothetical protein [Tanacetum cinerariifolium]